MGQAAIVAADETEAWRSAHPGIVSISVYGVDGRPRNERIPFGKTIHVTPKERRLVQERAAMPELDVFRNGMLVPVRLIDSEDDTESLQNTPNAMSDTAMKALFRSQIKTFKGKVDEISNLITLRRLLEVASDVDASMRQVEAINARIEAIAEPVSEGHLGGVGAAEASTFRSVAPR